MLIPLKFFLPTARGVLPAVFISVISGRRFWLFDMALFETYYVTDVEWFLEFKTLRLDTSSCALFSFELLERVTIFILSSIGRGVVSEGEPLFYVTIFRGSYE